MQITRPDRIFFRKACLGALLLLTGMLTSCNLSSPKRVEGTAPADTGIQVDSMGISIRPEVIETIQVIFPDTEALDRVMQRDDFAQLAGLLRSAVYDKKWNDSGLMVKMVTPDYLLIFSYENKDQEKPLEEMYIWKEGGRVKFRNLWYLLPTAEQNLLNKLIETYRQENR